MKFIRTLTVFTCCFFCLVSVNAQSNTSTPNTMLWRISGKDIKQPSYLFGTMHLRDKRIFNFTDSLYAAIEKSEGFAIEINPDEMAAELIKSFITKDTSGYVKDELDKEIYKKISKKLEKKYGAKVNKLTRRQAYLSRNEWIEDMAKPDDMNSFMDVYLYHMARQLGKWVGGIEDLEDQMLLLNREEKEFTMEDLLFDVGMAKNMLNQMVELYSNNQLQTIYELVVKTDDDKKALVLNRRNYKMSRRIDSLMHLRTGVFAVGAAHLPGDSGLISLLRTQGYKVEPVFSDKKIKPQEYQLTSSYSYWKTFTHSDSLYSVRYPSSSSPIYAAENLVKMEMCIDMPTSTYYITTGVPNYTKTVVSDKRMEEILSGVSSKGKVVSKTKIELDGLKGMEIIVEGESYIRARAYLNESYAFMFMIGHDKSKEAIINADADYFFNSFKPGAKAFTKQTSGYLHIDASLGYRVMLPHKPEKPKTETSAEWITSNLSSFDGVNEIYYMVITRSAGSGYYINGDSNYFNLLKEAWAGAGYRKMKEEQFYMGESAAMKYDLLQKEGKETFYTRTMSVNRGNRSFLLLATTNNGNENNPVIDRFFNSFQLVPYQSDGWNVRSSPDGIFSAYVPQPIIKKKLGDEHDTAATAKYVYRSYDTRTAITYELQPVTFADYYHAVNDSAIFHDALHGLKEYTDTVLETRTTTNSHYKSQDVVLGIEGSSLLRRLRFILKGDTVYAAYTFLQPAMLHHPDVDKYFNELQLHGPAVTTTLFQKKTKLLFEDLWSGDSARFVKAARQIDEVKFEKEDLPLLKQSLLKQYEPSEDTYPDIYNNIADAIHELNDSTILSFIDKGYFSLKVDNEGQRVAMLRLLARTKTKDSYTLFKRLLFTEQPATSFTYAYQTFLRDSLALTTMLFPEMLRLIGDTNYCYFAASLAATLLDSNYLQLSTVKEYEQQFLNIAGVAYTHFQKPEPDTWFYYEPLQLLARVNTKKGNEQLLRIASLHNGEINMSLLPALLANNVTVPAALLDRTAAEKEYRYGLYRQLEQRQLETYFPAKYRSQKMMAESDVYLMAADDGEYEVEDVVFLQTKKRAVNGVQRIFYLYKVKLEGEWYLGISGGFSTNAKRIIQDKNDDTGGIYWEETFNNKKIDEFFEAYFNQ